MLKLSGNILALNTFLFLMLFSACKNKHNTLFELRENTGIAFNNRISENDSMNVLDLEYFYRGGGVAIGDINNDQLPDVILGGNMVPTRLYLNKGDLQFEDITEQAGLLNNSWVNGISLVDINQDGRMDIYFSVGGSNNAAKRKNLFYIQEASASHTPSFIEKANELGLDTDKSTTQAAFFDYDLDGDLDVILANTDPQSNNPNVPRAKVTDGSANNCDLFYENRLNEPQHQKFVERSKEVGILYDGFSLGVSVADINMDGWPDIYIANDHLSNDLYYINKQGKSFENKAAQTLKTQSYFSMGVFIKDIDNNGLNDIFTLDMLPETNDRRQRMMMAMNLYRLRSSAMLGYQVQFMKNTLQLNLGAQNNNSVAFSEVAQFAGIHDTDWSWGSVIADFDLDGKNDIIVANGYARNITDMDFISYQSFRNTVGEHQKDAEHKENIINQPPILLHNYAFRNKGELQFENMATEWGLQGPDLSNGIAYGDLDLDGDLDLIINHINQQASVYENISNNNNYNYIKVHAIDTNSSPMYGTKVFVFVDDSTTMYQELFPVQGYQSTQEPMLHFGVGTATVIDAIEVVFPDGTVQRLTSAKTDTTYTFTLANFATHQPEKQASAQPSGYIQQSAVRFPWRHQPLQPYGDMEKQTLLHQTFSKESPPLAVADFDSNGLLDFYAGGGLKQQAAVFKQVEPMVFVPEYLEKGGEFEDTGAIWFDADQDGDLDLYVCSGNTQFWEGDNSLQDRLYLQTSTGWEYAKSNLPELKTFTKEVVTIDFDQDGDLDLLVFGRIKTGLYPTAPLSYLLENEHGKFINQSAKYLPASGAIGMVSDVAKADIDGDGYDEIIIAREWEKISLLQWENGKFSLKDIDETSKGWWHAVHVADINQDGLPDILCGNAGLNNDYAKHLPLVLFVANIDGNLQPDPLLGWHIKNGDQEKELLPAFQRDDLIAQFSFIRNDFSKYGDFAALSMDEVVQLSQDVPKQLEIEDLNSILLLNKNGGEFEKIILPKHAQLGPLTAFVSDDFDNDHSTDILCLGNAQNMHLSKGWNSDYSACLLTYKKGKLKSMPTSNVGVYINDEVRAASKLGAHYFITANYADSLRVFSWK